MAMQNLRDKLLKAGLVDKKQKTQVDTQDRRDKKQKGAEQLAAEEAQKQLAFAEKLAAEAEARRKSEAERAAERARHEDRERVRNLCERWAVRQRRPGPQRFYFTRRSGAIGYLLVSDELGEQLQNGGLAIVELLDDHEQEVALLAARASSRPRSLLDKLKAEVAGPAAVTIEAHVLLPPEHAERVYAIDPTAVRYWARRSEPIGVFAEPSS
jgi:uncharacterized protein YaiL (DUF2058 family)